MLTGPSTSVAALFLSAVLVAVPVRAQGAETDTLYSPDHRSPQGALWRAAAVPGWGQIYTGQYYKLPFVYVGLGGLAASALYNNDRYLLYRHALFYARDPVANSRYADEAAPFAQIIAANRHEELLRPQRNAYRRNRDLSYIGIGLFYALTILDAYVNAHLLDFDVDEDLSIRLLPGANGKVGIHAAWRLK